MSSLMPFTQGIMMLGQGVTSGYGAVGKTVTAPIRVGNRSMLPEGEIEALRLARIAGFSKAETADLVAALMAARQTLASDAEIFQIVRDMQAARIVGGIPVDPAQAARAAKGKRMVEQRIAKKAVEAAKEAAKAPTSAGAAIVDSAPANASAESTT